MGENYIYALTPLLESAMISSDIIHRQISCNIIQHISLNVDNLNHFDLLIHFFNLIWPNIFESTPHMRRSTFNVIDSLRISIGATSLIYYVFLGLFHASKKVRDIYWVAYNLFYVGSQASLVVSNQGLSIEKIFGECFVL